MITILHYYAYLFIIICLDDVLNLNYIWMPLQLSESVYLVIQLSWEAIVQLVLLNDFDRILFPSVIVNRHYILIWFAIQM